VGKSDGTNHWGTRMNLVTIRCTETDWRHILEHNLEDGLEVELLKLNWECDADYCRGLARKHSMTFELTKEHNYGVFKKMKPN